jgi:hypothetical protein
MLGASFVLIIGLWPPAPDTEPLIPWDFLDELGPGWWPVTERPNHY